MACSGQQPELTRLIFLVRFRAPGGIANPVARGLRAQRRRATTRPRESTLGDRFAHHEHPVRLAAGNDDDAVGLAKEEVFS